MYIKDKNIYFFPLSLGSLANLVNVGQCIALVLAYSIGDRLHWRDVNYVFLAFTLASTGLIIFAMPETPYYLVQNGRVEEARNNMRCVIFSLIFPIILFVQPIVKNNQQD